MRQFYTILLLLFCAGGLSAQTLADEEKIVQQCINFKPLQEYYHAQAPLYIMQHGIYFGNIHPTYKDKEIQFLSKDEVKAKNPESCITFWIYEVNKDKARVQFFYNNALRQNVVTVTLFLEKKGNDWVTVNSELTK